MDSAARGLRGARRFSILVFVGFCFLDVAFSQNDGVVSPPAPPGAGTGVDAPTPAPSPLFATAPQISAPTILSPPPPVTAAPEGAVPPPKESPLPRPPTFERSPPSPPGVVLEPTPSPGLEPPPPPPPLTTEETLSTKGNTWNPSEKAGVVIASIAALLQVAVVAFLLIKRHQMLSTVGYDDIDDLESDDPRHNADYRHADSA